MSLERIKELLDDIEHGRGPYKIDRHEHAVSVIEHAKECARELRELLLPKTDVAIQATIDQLEETRRRNNVNWMALVRLAFETSPARARQIMLQICRADEEIMEVARKLAE